MLEAEVEAPNWEDVRSCICASKKMFEYNMHKFRSQSRATMQAARVTCHGISADTRQ